jgi:hypothetical protein
VKKELPVEELGAFVSVHLSRSHRHQVPEGNPLSGRKRKVNYKHILLTKM